MNFHDYQTEYERLLGVARKTGDRQTEKRVRAVPCERFLRDTLLRHPQAQYLAAEGLWHTTGRPYYAVYPDYAAVFGRTKLDVPAYFLRSPQQAFVVRFAVDREPTFGLVRLESFLFTLVEDPPRRHIFSVTILYRQHGAADRGSENPRSLATLTYPIACDKLQTTSLADFVADVAAAPMTRMSAGGDTGVVHDAFDANRAEISGFCLANAMSVCFLATGGDRLVEPDVLSRDLRDYLEAVNARDKASVERLHAKATGARGTVGHVVGRGETLLGRRYERSADGRDPEGVGAEYHWQTQRGSHMHRYWIKDDNDPSGKRLVVRFVRQHTLRPDLPVRPDGDRAGARTLTGKEEEQRILGREEK